MKKNYLLIMLIALSILSIQSVNAQVSGTAFRDFNADGVQQAGEPGVEGIIVKAYKNDATTKDAFVMETTSANDGTYTLNIPAGDYPVRLEFEIPASGAYCQLAEDEDYPAAGGSNYGTSIQFVHSSGETHDFAISYPFDFSIESNPWVFTSVLGSGDPLAGGTSSQMPGIIKFRFNNRGLAPSSGRPTNQNSHNNDDPPGSEDYGDDWIELVNFGKVGTIGALAYSRQAKKIFASAILKRHCGLGPLGSGGIYIIDTNPANNANVNFVNLDDIGIATQGSGAYVDGITSGGGTDEEGYFSPVIGTNAERGLPADKTTPSHDPAAYTQVGKLSLGDIDISEDGRYLYVVNLYDRKLYEIDLQNPENPVIPTANEITSYQIPDAVALDQNIDQSKGGEYRPFGLKIYRGKAYVGIVGSGQAQNGDVVGGLWGRADGNQKAYVYSMDLESGQWQKDVEIDLSKRDEPWYSWYVWTNLLRDGNNKETQPEHGIPIIGDIEFDNGGNMLISFVDIHAHQLGFLNYGLQNNNSMYAISVGDLMRAPRTGNVTQCIYDEPQQDNGKYTDYYNDNLRHTESSGGMLAGHHTSDYDAVLSLFMDPLTNYDANGGTENGFSESYGTLLYNNNTGQQVYESSQPGPGYEIIYLDVAHMGKANALGDLETLEIPPPIEIGNLIWEDSDNDGIQDADESGIANVNVQLLDDQGTVIATTTSDANGNYIFNHTNVNVNGIVGLQPNTSYTVRIDPAQFNNGAGIAGTPLESKSLTTKDQSGTSSKPDRSDSDGETNVNSEAVISVITGGPGENNHSYDFGFTEQAACSLTDADKTNESCNDNGTGGDSSDDYISFDLNPTGTGLGTDYSVSVDNGGTISPTSGTYGSATSFQLQAGSANGTTYTVTITDNADPNCTITTTVQQNSCSGACSLTDAGKTNETCNDGGTGSDPADDYITFNLNPTGSNLSAGYTVSVNNGGTINPTSGTYGSATTFQLQAGSANGTTYTITITDNSDPNCTITTTVQQSSCSGACSLTDAGKTNESCNDGGSGSDPADDYITFNLNPTGSNLSAGYSVSVNNGGTISPTSGTYGSATSFQLQAGSADGTIYTITITDNADPNCTITTTAQQNSCSDECDLTGATVQNVECNNPNTNADTGDDYITFDMIVTGVNTSGVYTVSASSGSITPTTESYGTVNSFTLGSGSAGGGDVTITITDSNDPNCTITATVEDPGTCSVCTVVVDAGASQTICDGSCTDLNATASGGDAPYTYQWNTGDITSSIHVCPTANTTYTVTVTDTQGCTAESSVTVTVESCPFDLALKLTTSQTLPVRPGDIVPFTITVCNQSDITVEEVEVTDYIPDGFTLADATWTAGNVGHTGNSASKIFSIANGELPAGGLAPDQCLDFTIDLEVNSHSGPDDFTNYAEITFAEDEYGHTEDVDSDPGTDSAHELAVGCGDADDDNMDGRYKLNGSDEDDHDPACVDIFDLALKKVETSTGPYKYGDQVTFTYTVYNQGNIAATNIEVTDYVPSGFEYDPALNASWTQSTTTTPATTITSTLNPGESTTVTLILRVKSTDEWEIGWTNRAEISGGEDLTGRDLHDRDYDSILDNNPDNDAGGNPDTASDDSIDGDGTGAPGDNDPATDEDDADPARVKVYDLALRKVLLTQPPYEYYDDVTFEIEVFNQGNEDMTDIVVSDYIPAGYTFDSGLNAGWSGAAPTVSTTIASLTAGASTTVQLVLKLVQTDGGVVDWDNYAEITSMKDKNGVVADTWDSDSTPDSDSVHERAVKPDDTDDDNIDGHFIPDGTDEDDHDPAGIPVFDLALKKVESSVGPYRYGDNVTFTFTVYNQGNIGAKNIEITDYVPSGFEFSSALNPNWIYGGPGTALTTIVDDLAPGSSTEVTLILILQPTDEVDEGWVNRGEISKADDSAGNDMTNADIDSDADDNRYNDAGGTPDTDEDDNVSDDGKDGDGDGITDEDDADPARVKVYDLALRKVMLTQPPYEYYDDVTFEIEVFNQGNEEMTDIVVSDYIPAGYTFDSGLNAGWSGAAPTVSTTISSLAAGASTTVQLVLKLAQTDGGLVDWDNYAEITSMKDKNGVVADTWDSDSTPGTDSATERAVKPGDPDDDNIDGHFVPDGTDEDDHDPAGIEVLDLALTKTSTVVEPYSYGQEVDFVLTVYNQGNKVAHDIEIVDYVPSGFGYYPHINSQWTQAITSTPKITIAGPLAPGASTTVTIRLKFQYTAEVGGHANRAEITSALDEEGEVFDDIDSTPDDNPDNDAGGTVDTPEDDNITDDGVDGDGDGVTDEDDADPWGVKVASIGNYVWYDDNDNGIQDDGTHAEVGVQGITAILTDCNDNEILRTITDENGYYSFGNLIPGNYLVKFEDLPEDSEWAMANVGNDALDSDADENGITICTLLDPDEDDPSWDAGIIRLSSIGDYVWLDTDEDGIQDADESGVQDVVVRLLDENGDVLATTTTDAEGYYLFEELHPGTYIVEFVEPEALDFTGVDQGGDDNEDSDADIVTGRTNPIDLGANEDIRDVDAGLKCTIDVELTEPETICEGETIDIVATVTGGAELITYIWTTGESTTSITVTPLVTTVYGVTVTDKYGCEDYAEVTITVEPKAKIGDYVWFDKNHDGLQDFFNDDPELNEIGINGVTVNLYEASNPTEVYMTQLTHSHIDTIGFYEFEVCAGDYFVEFIPPTGLGYQFTEQDAGTDDAFDSDANPITGRTIITHLSPGENDPTWDAGLYKTASLGDFVWHDVDVDGIQDLGEEGIDGVLVTLYRADFTVVGTTTTANGGLYEFTNLNPGDYFVEFDYSNTIYTEISPKDEGVDDTVDSDVFPNGRTEITTIIAGENDVTWDMGLYSLASLGDYVWLDKDADGCQDVGEEGIEGVTVRLFADDDSNGVPDGNMLAETQTDNDGFYEFLNLAAGTYLVQFIKPLDYKVSPKNNNGAGGCDDTSDSDGHEVQGYSDPIPLADNEHNPTIDQGYFETARLGDFVWYDKNGDGVQDPDEEGVSGVTVTLYKDTDGDGEPDTPVDTKVTNTGNEAGGYTFEDVDPGVYKICFDTDGDYDGFTIANSGSNDTVDSDADQVTGCTEIIVVESGDDDMTFDVGLIKTAELGDYVWEDKNADGYQDPTEAPISGVMVILEDGQGNQLGTTYTDVDGFYKFEDLLPGDYIVHFEKPLGYEPTDKDAVPSDTKDSDASPVTGDSHLVTLEAGDSDMTIDAGFYKPASLGDYVWEDKDGDGVQDPDEDGINGIVVTLYDGDGNPIENTTTGANPSTGEDGFYEFDNLEPGEYYVCFDKGNYDKYTSKDEGSNNAEDSDADPVSGCTEIVVLESGDHNPTLDAGLYNLASLGDYVWLDDNSDGLQDSEESGINGLEVKLYVDTNGDGSPDGVAIATTTTTSHAGKDGYYIFEDLEPGDYIVLFPEDDAYELTDANVGTDDALDSDANEDTGLSHTVNLESGEHDPTIDGGYYYTARLGDYVWYDEDGDGIQDETEKCIDSVKIFLYNVVETAVPGVLDTVKVDSTWSHMVIEGTDTICGFYEFTKLKPGDYILRFENPDTDVYQTSPKDKLYNDAVDSDIDEFGSTTTITLVPGEDNPTIDAGFYKGECLEGVVWEDREEPYCEDDPNNQGQQICTVEDVHDIFDTPYEGIVVDLYSDGDINDSNDDVKVMSTLTDTDGLFDFSNIKVGTYYLVLNLPSGITTVNNDVGGDDKIDNDFYLSEATGLYRSYTFAIEAQTDDKCLEDVDGGTKQRNTLPLEMVSFEASWNKVVEAVDLRWDTRNEINLDYFKIERRAEGEELFTEQIQVDAKGDTEGNRYGLYDKNVEKGMRYYYRLIPIDLDGIENSYYEGSVLVPGDKFTVRAFPNPVTDKLYIVISGKRGDNTRIEILDNVGRKVMRAVNVEQSNSIYEKVPMDISKLPQGQYYIRVVSGQRVEIKKLVHLR